MERSRVGVSVRVNGAINNLRLGCIYVFGGRGGEGVIIDHLFLHLNAPFSFS